VAPSSTAFQGTDAFNAVWSTLLRGVQQENPAEVLSGLRLGLTTCARPTLDQVEARAGLTRLVRVGSARWIPLPGKPSLWNSWDLHHAHWFNDLTKEANSKASSGTDDRELLAIASTELARRLFHLGAGRRWQAMFGLERLLDTLQEHGRTTPEGYRLRDVLTAWRRLRPGMGPADEAGKRWQETVGGHGPLVPDMVGLDPVVVEAWQDVVRRERLAYDVNRHLAHEGIRRDRLNSESQWGGPAPGGPASIPLATETDSLFIQAILPSETLAFPLILIWYQHGGSNQSLLPPSLRGPAPILKGTPAEFGIRWTLSLVNQTNGMPGPFTSIPGPEDVEFQAALEHSRGKFLVAAVPRDREEVTRVWEGRGSIDLSGALFTAREAESSGDLETAGRLALEVTQANPSLAEGWYQAGQHHRRRGELFSARRAFETALTHDPGHFRAWTGLGLCSIEQKRDGEALVCFRQSYEIQPFFIDNLLTFASLLAVRHPERRGEALDLLWLARDISPRHEAVVTLWDTWHKAGLDPRPHFRRFTADPRLA
jgi:tetratricopeptide (TPR) repeat protein